MHIAGKSAELLRRGLDVYGRLVSARDVRKEMLKCDVVNMSQFPRAHVEDEWSIPARARRVSRER